MKFAVIASLALAAISSVNGASMAIPAEHHARFLEEIDTLQAELAAWKASPAGQAAIENGFYTEQVTPSFAESLSTNDEDLKRFFLAKLTAEKAQRENPKATFGINSPFTMMTDEEFAAFVRRSSRGRTTFRELAEEAMEVQEVDEVAEALPATVDWTKSSSCVPPVKNQGKCGSCWAFSGVAVLESAMCFRTGRMQLLSEQQVVSCDRSSSGCDGGWPSSVLNFANNRRGMCSQASYPYTSGNTTVSNTETCTQFSNACTKVPVSLREVRRVQATETSFRTAISRQPVSVVLAAGNPSWKQYTGGVVSSCSTTKLDHAVLAVGYDATSYKIKNSWGAKWGMNGYILLERQGEYQSACSMTNGNALYPIVN